MSDTGDTNQNSLLTNLKNKVSYNLHKATYDPEANKFVKEQSQQQKDELEKKKEQQAETTEQNSDPNKFSTKRLISKVGNQTLDILKKIFYPFAALMLAMIVTNEMIVYSVPIRIIFFIFTFVLCFFFKYITVLLGTYYIFKGGYSYYINNMTDRPKTDIMPTIFALLPITTYKPESSFGSFIMYPFTYPKTVDAEATLPKIMKRYWQSLQNSFPGLDRVKNMPIFVNGLKKVQEELTHLNEIKPENKTTEFKSVESIETHKPIESKPSV